MLSSLTIESLGLIDTYTFIFQDGFTSITGETGSGKTSLIEALKLALGKKSDFEFIKKGAKKAHIKACFELSADHLIYPLLIENGFKIDPGEALIISRFLTFDGKSKAFLNDQPISLSFLSRLALFLCDFIDQDSLLEMHNEEKFLELLDKTGPYESLIQDYKTQYGLYCQLQTKLKNLQKQTDDKDFKQILIQEEIKELKEGLILPEEEEKLFNSYKNAQAIQSKLTFIEAHIQSFNQLILPQLRKMKVDKTLNEEQKALIESAFINLCEVSSQLEASIEEDSLDPEKLKQIENRLKLIHSLKRKYHVESDQFNTILDAKTKELDLLFSLDDELQKTLKDSEKSFIQVTELAEKIAKQRICWAEILQENIHANLRPLNMPFAELQFSFKKIPLNENGCQKVELLLKANAASNMVALHQGASGGELARINFCFFLESSKKHKANTYVFDEIDASVGGVTSALMGDKLKKLSEDKQVFCITHFPQMAQKATNHLVFEKKQNFNSTFINILYSNQGPIESEIERMIGVKE